MKSVSDLLEVNHRRFNNLRRLWPAKNTRTLRKWWFRLSRHIIGGIIILTSAANRGLVPRHVIKTERDEVGATGLVHMRQITPGLTVDEGLLSGIHESNTGHGAFERIFLHNSILSMSLKGRQDACPTIITTERQKFTSCPTTQGPLWSRHLACLFTIALCGAGILPALHHSPLWSRHLACSCDGSAKGRAHAPVIKGHPSGNTKRSAFGRTSKRM